MRVTRSRPVASRIRAAASPVAFALAVCLTAGAGPRGVAAQTPVPLPGPTLLTKTRVLDVRAGRYLPAPAVLIEGGRISRLYQQEPTDLPAGVEVLELNGLTLVPGLGDMHARAHPGPDADADYFYAMALAHGVTTYRVLDAPLPWAAAQRDRANAGLTLAPRLWTSGPAIGPGAAVGLAVRGVRDAGSARLEVRRQAAAKVDWISVRAGVPDEVLKAILVEAADGGGALPASPRQGVAPRGKPTPGRAATAPAPPRLRVAVRPDPHSLVALSRFRVHSIEGLGFPARSRDQYVALLGGLPGFPGNDTEAVVLFAWAHGPGPDLKSAVAELARTRVPVVPLLAAGAGLSQLAGLDSDPALEYLPPGRKDDLLRRRGLAVPATGAPTSTPQKTPAPAPASPTPPAPHAPDALLGPAWKAQAALIRNLARANGIIATGVDVDGAGYSVPGAGVHRELELLVAAGLTPAEAIRAATTNCAALLGASDTDGEIRVGSHADLFAVEGDPLKRIEDLRRIKVVIRRGEVLDPADLLAQARRALRR